MAQRPIFIPGRQSGPLFEEIIIDFQWHSGFAPSQKQKSMRELHKSAAKKGFESVLEVSTKSELELGRRLSAFRLDVELRGFTSKIECIYQGAKVFEKGGPYPELFEMKPIEAKRFFRDKNLGMITHFKVENTVFENLPVHAFYDWLFLRALRDHVKYLKKNLKLFDAFSDIEFNPARSVNTQARSMAIIQTLISRDEIHPCANDFDIFRDHLTDIELRYSNTPRFQHV